jgi:hypothetical protein
LTVAFTKWGPYTASPCVWALIPINPATQEMCSSALIHLLLHQSSNTMSTMARNYLLGNLSLLIVSFHSLAIYYMHLAWPALIHLLLYPTPTWTTARGIIC